MLVCSPSPIAPIAIETPAPSNSRTSVHLGAITDIVTENVVLRLLRRQEEPAPRHLEVSYSGEMETGPWLSVLDTATLNAPMCCEKLCPRYTISANAIPIHIPAHPNWHPWTGILQRFASTLRMMCSAWILLKFASLEPTDSAYLWVSIEENHNYLCLGNVDITHKLTWFQFVLSYLLARQLLLEKETTFCISEKIYIIYFH